MASESVQNLGLGLSAIIGGRTVTFDKPEQKFESLAAEWKTHQMGLSTTNYHHAAYLQIIGMGMPAVPFLLNRLRAGERRWVVAIKSIAGEQVDTPEMRGDAERVLQAWIDWGVQRGFIHARI